MANAGETSKGEGALTRSFLYVGGLPKRFCEIAYNLVSEGKYTLQREFKVSYCKLAYNPVLKGTKVYAAVRFRDELF